MRTTTVHHLIHGTAWHYVKEFADKKHHNLYKKLVEKNPVPNTDEVVLEFNEQLTPNKELVLPLHNQWLGFVIKFDPDEVNEAKLVAILLDFIHKTQNNHQMDFSNLTSKFDKLME